ncbi:hypothetical protein ACQ859_15595 [Roseateles chitinivorans]|uniref:golvesin C-terminal-like domain-containing protein n=1 Tax=Roseateles chitinivorans TaxID=2917965 RepID=UPI003D66894E
MNKIFKRHLPQALPWLIVASAASAQTTVIVDNSSPGFSSSGIWSSSTAGSPTFAGTDHLVAPGLNSIVDNASPQFSKVGNWTVRTDGTRIYGANFLTAPVTPRFPHHYPVVIVDNKTNDTFTRGQVDWPTSQSLSGYHGEDYAAYEVTYQNVSKVTAMTYQSRTLYGGTGIRDVRLSARWPVSSTNASNAVVRVRLDSMPNSPQIAQYTVNQRTLSGEWQALGTFSVAGEDKLRIEFDATNADGRVIADAIKLEQVESSPVAAARWNLPTNGPGDFMVYARWPAFAGAGSGTPVWTLVGGQGTTTPGVGTNDLSQARVPGLWTAIGRVNLRGSQPNYVLLEDSGSTSSGVIAADAVVVTQYGYFPIVTWNVAVEGQTTDVYAQWSADSTRAADAQYAIAYWDASCTRQTLAVTVDQRDAGAATGAYLGRITTGACSLGRSIRVQLMPGSGVGTLSADAIRFVSF